MCILRYQIARATFLRFAGAPWAGEPDQTALRLTPGGMVTRTVVRVVTRATHQVSLRGALSSSVRRRAAVGLLEIDADPRVMIAPGAATGPSRTASRHRNNDEKKSLSPAP